MQDTKMSIKSILSKSVLLVYERKCFNIYILICNMKSISNQGSEIGLNKWYWTQRLSIWKKGKVRALLHTIKTAYLVSLCFTSLSFANYIFFKKWRFVATLPPPSQWHHFPNSICSLPVFVSYLVTFTIFQTFSFLLYVLWWSVCDKWSLIL